MPARTWIASGMPVCLLLLLALPAAAQPTGDTKPPSPAALQFFESKIRPILAANCFECHGPKKQRGDLRLDSRAAILEGGDQGPAVVPGSPEKSLLIKAIRYDDKRLKMPPTKKLPREHIDDLTTWVKMGAPWPGADKVAVAPKKGEFRITDKDRAHWAFRPIHRPAAPAVKDRNWTTNPIDTFILAGLEAHGLKPNPPASRNELIRRVTYDLTGLPPTPAEVQAFLADQAPDAYEKLIDRLLASPQYGEKWARAWLDLVRYAETNSYERDNPKPNAWRYRDYVIRAFNADRPYDRFIKEQLAGDELAPGDADALTATGYYRLGIWDDEPSDPKQARYDGLDDIVATTSQVFLGLTMDCARCHNHKIDPISQKDYYRFLSFFHNVNHYRGGAVPTDLRPILGPEAKQRYEQLVKELEAKRNQVQDDLSAIEKELRVALEKAGKGAAQGFDLDDLTYRYYRDSWMKLPDFTLLKAEDAGRLPRNLFDLGPRTRDEAFGFVYEGVLIVPAAGKYTFFLDSDDGSRLTVNGKQVIEYDGIHGEGNEKSATVTLPKGRLPIKLEYFQNKFGFGLTVAWSGPDFKDRRYLSVSPRQAGGDLSRLMTQEGPKLLGKERVATYDRLKKTLAALKKQNVPGEMALCVSEAGATVPETRVLMRGNPHTPGDVVEPGFPEVLPGGAALIPPPPKGATTSGRRLVLANWIASPDNPLTARVMANRVWQYHFGRGIVRSTSDFGYQGTKPTHPELLDWLASELIANGWRLKPLHRTILLSSAYRMSSKAEEKALAADPANDHFWRFDMRRLTAEEIRDSLLAVSGNLNLKMFGPGVYPEIPKEVLAGQSVPGNGWKPSPPEEAARRSVYIHVKRSLLYPILESFDIAETDRSVPVRFATIQPTQALAMINGDFLNRQAVVFADRLRREEKDVTAQVRRGLFLATQRAPTDAEVRRGVDLIQALRREDGLSEAAALNGFCLVVLNLNEFMYLD
jgi:hypothetical protein